MGSAEVPSSQHTPASIVPHFGKVSEDEVQAASDQLRGVFDESKFRSAAVNDASKLAPKARTLAGANTQPLPGDRNILARESTCDDGNKPTPRYGIESADVVPDGEFVEQAVSLPLEDGFAAVRLDFDGRDRSPAK